MLTVKVHAPFGMEIPESLYPSQNARRVFQRRNSGCRGTMHIVNSLIREETKGLGQKIRICCKIRVFCPYTVGGGVSLP